MCLLCARGYAQHWGQNSTRQQATWAGTLLRLGTHPGQGSPSSCPGCSKVEQVPRGGRGSERQIPLLKNRKCVHSSNTTEGQRGARNTVVPNLFMQLKNSGVRLLRFKNSRYHVMSRGSRTSFQTSLCLNFFIYKMGYIIVLCFIVLLRGFSGSFR